MVNQIYRKAFILIILCTLIFSSYSKSIVKAPIFRINTSDNVKVRYEELNARFKDKLVVANNRIINGIKEHLGGNIGYYVLSMVMKFFLYSKVDSIMFEEIVEMSKATGLPASNITLLNYYYELASVGCTSIVARNFENRIILASNLDFAYPDQLADLAF